MKRLVFRIAIAITALLLLMVMPTSVVLADVSVNITITAIPWVSGGILGFTITYVNPQRIDFSWNHSPDVGSVMIRGKYGSYPNDIPDVNTAPSDGYQVYYGNLHSASDTSIDMDNNAGTIYYKAWAQKLDGTWYMTTSSGSKENSGMLAIFFGLLAVGSTLAMFLSKGARSPLLGFPCGILWFLLGGYCYTTLRVTSFDIWGISSFAFFFLGIFMIYVSFAFNGRDLDFTRKQSLESGLFIDEGKRKATEKARQEAREEAKRKSEDIWHDDDDDAFEISNRPSARSQELHRRAALRRSGVIRAPIDKSWN